MEELLIFFKFQLHVEDCISHIKKQKYYSSKTQNLENSKISNKYR